MYEEQALVAAARAEASHKTGTVSYEHNKEGKLSPTHLRMRAQRWAAKIFLSHWHAEACRRILGIEPPKPYAIEHLGHVHEIDPPQDIVVVDNEEDLDVE